MLITMSSVISTRVYSSLPLQTHLTQETQQSSIRPNAIHFFRDQSGELELQDILSAEINAKFKPASRNIGLGYIQDAVWLKLDVKRDVKAIRQWLLEVEPAYLDDVRVYQKQFNAQGEEHWRIFRSGDRLAYEDRSAPHHTALFKLEVPEGHSTLYMRIRSTSTMIVLPTLWDPDVFQAEQTKKTYGYGLY